MVGACAQVLAEACGWDEARVAREMARVLKPGGFLVVQETNTNNPLFRFYMGYVFPILSRIDDVTIVAETGDGRDALELIDVEYEVLPALLDPAAAMARDDVRIHEVSRERDATGAPAYEANVFISFDKNAGEYTALATPLVGRARVARLYLAATQHRAAGGTRREIPEQRLLVGRRKPRGVSALGQEEERRFGAIET